MAHGHMYEVNKITQLNEEELRRKIFKPELSWHHEYRNSSYIHVGGLHLQLSEGDIVAVFSQFGEI